MTGTATVNGKALDVARARKATAGPAWSSWAQKSVADGPKRCHVLSSLATAKARDAPFALGGSVRAAWLRRWQGMLGCAAARAFAESLLEGLATGGVGGPTLSTNDVLGDARFG